MARSEQDTRVEILNTLLKTPHRRLDEVHLVHQEMLESDPRFYPHLAVWYFGKGEVRDHKEMFVVCLVMSPRKGHRDVGLALLRQLPPHQVLRVVDFIRGTVTKRKVREEAPKAKGKAKQRKAKQPAPAVVVEQRQGLFASPPRSLRTEVERYLREREGDATRFDRVVLQSRKDLKRLYALFHVKPGPRAQAILFDNQPPEDSRLHTLKLIAKENDPVAQAKLIAEHKIPYRIASTVIRGMQPAVLAALIDAMTPQELINNMASLKRRGALDNAQLKKLVDSKLKSAQQDKRVQAYKAKEAIKAAGLTGEVADQLDQVTEQRIKAKGRIRQATAILVDKSGSMVEAIELGKRLATMLSSVMEAPLYVYAFDTMAHAIEVPKKATLKAWEQAFEGIEAIGGTSCGVALEWMRRKKQQVEQLIVITDEGENTQPVFVTAYAGYAGVYGEPRVVFVKTRNASDYLERQCKTKGIDFEAFQFDGDYYALPNLVPLLAQPSKIDLVMEIMDTELPERAQA